MLYLRYAWALLAFVFMAQGFTSLQASPLAQAQVEHLAANNPPKKKVKILCRKWKMDAQVLRDAMTKSLAEMEEEQREMMNAMLEPMLEMMGNITFTFDSKGSLEVAGGPDGETQQGTWKMDSKGETLTLTMGDGEASEFRIEQLDAKRLILKPLNAENPGDPMAEAGLQLIPTK